MLQAAGREQDRLATPVLYALSYTAVLAAAPGGRDGSRSQLQVRPGDIIDSIDSIDTTMKKTMIRRGDTPCCE